MTSASELFYSRRSRFGRSTVLDLGGGEGGPDSSMHRISHQNNNIRRHRHANHQHSATRRDHHRRLDIDGCDPPLPRRPRYHRSSVPEREAGFLDQASSHSASPNINNSENGSATQDRIRFTGNNRLPGTVLLARARLLERLRGVSLSANRQSDRILPSTHHDDLTVEVEFRLADAEDWENVSREWLAETIPLPDVLSLEKRKRPPGLTQEAVNSLQVETFIKLDEVDEDLMSRSLQECSICLESFLEGDKLICVPCGHRFHCHCLQPWVRMCGDCPYCRTKILLTNQES